MKKENDLMQKITALCKRRGFVFSSSEIYGGLANSYTYGPYGTELKNNIKKLWWQKFVETRDDMVGLDGPIMLNPKVWEASGHAEGFNDAMVDCKECKKRFRADHLVEEATGKDLEGQLEEMTKVIKNEKIKCPECGKRGGILGRIMWPEQENFYLSSGCFVKYQACVYYMAVIAQQQASGRQ